MAAILTFKFRRNTASGATTSNPTLAAGEPGLETDTGLVKFGDGATAWTSLPYAWVGPTATQTLTNKTLTSPTLTTPTINNGTANNVSENYPVLKAPQEFTTVSATSATGTVNFDANTQGVLYYTTAATANWTLNFRADSTHTLSSILAVGEAITLVFVNTNGATAYYPNAFTIDGVSVTPKWAGGTAPTAGDASALDAYTFTIVKTASTPTYTVLASVVKYA